MVTRNTTMTNVSYHLWKKNLLKKLFEIFFDEMEVCKFCYSSYHIPTKFAVTRC